MPTFDTPKPISVMLDLVVGDVSVTAGDRGDTVVQVRPSDASHEPDVRAAQQTQIDYAAGRLLVKAPKQRRVGLFGKVGSIDVSIDLPADSQIQAGASVAAFRCSGRVGECQVKTSSGDIQFDHAGALDLNTGFGAVVVDRVVGHAEVRTGSGRVRLREIDGTAVIKNSNGDTWIGAISGDLRAHAANGDICVDRADATVAASTANGDVRIGEVAQGATSLKTACGEIEIGIRAGTAARLDVSTSFGRVRNLLETIERPEPAEATVEVHARTSYGDIVIRRCHYPE